MKKRLILILLIFVLILGAIIAAFFFRPARNETLNSYVEKLRANGEKMTFEEMIASLSQHTNDSLAILTNIVRQIGAPPSDTTNTEAMQFSGQRRTKVAWKQNSPPWATNLTWSDIGDRIITIAGPLAKLHGALKQPAPNGGFRANVFVKPTPWIEVKTATLWLADETLWNLHEERPADALASIQALAGLANLHREENSLVSQIIRIAVADVGLGLIWEALQTKTWSDGQLLALQESWASIDLLEAVERGLEGERCMGRESIKKVGEENPLTAKRFSNSYYGTNFLDGDLLFQLRHIQGYVEQVRALRTNRPWSEVSDSLDRAQCAD